MLSRKELAFVFASIVIMALILNIVTMDAFISSLIFSIVIILVSVFAKKIAARFLDVKVELTIWRWYRWGLGKRSHFKYPIPVGILLPVLLSFLSDGWIKCLTFLQFSATALPSKVAKKYGRKRFAGIMDWDDALLVFWSTVPLLLLALILKGYLPELSKLSIYYVLWNLIPLGQLDGSRLFFGSRVLFIFTWIITLAATWIVLA